jgi:hypothetical protein
MKLWFRALLSTVAVVLVGCSGGESRKVIDRFLTALKDQNYAAAHAELHSDAKALVPTPDVLRALVEKRGKRLNSWSSNCSAGGGTQTVAGFNTSSTMSAGASEDEVTIGVPPARGERCRVGPLFVELRQEAGVWKIRSCRY